MKFKNSPQNCVPYQVTGLARCLALKNFRLMIRVQKDLSSSQCGYPLDWQAGGSVPLCKESMHEWHVSGLCCGSVKSNVT